MKRTAMVLLTAMAWRASAGSEDLLDRVTRLQPFATHRESSSNEALDKNGDARSIAPGGVLVLGDLEGPGVITHLWCTVGSRDPFYPRALVLRVYYDGGEQPSVVAPLGDFFGVGHAAMADYSSLPVSVTSHGRARNCYWRMPFAKSVRVTVTNESPEQECDSFYYYLDWEKYPELPRDIAYFHAQYRQATPAEPGDYTILETTGRGQYVGTVYSVHQMENGWFGEGDDRFFIDGEETPSLRGTGSEDYFGDAWGFRQFYRPFYGVSLWEGYFAGDRVTAYRWHLPDPVTFTKSLKVTIEHRGSIFTDQMVELGGFIERRDWIGSVAFWYQTPPAALEAALPSLEKRLPPYRVLNTDTLPVRADPALIMLKQEGGVLYLPSKTDASIEFDFEVKEAGKYRIDAVCAYAFLGGVYQPCLDGQPVGAPRDFCSEGMDYLWLGLDSHVLEAGVHTLRFEGRERSPYLRSLSKKAYGLGLLRIALLRLEDMAGYQEGLKAVQKDQKPLLGIGGL